MDAVSPSVMQKIDLSTENAAVFLELKCTCGSMISSIIEHCALLPSMDPPVDRMYL